MGPPALVPLAPQGPTADVQLLVPRAPGRDPQREQMAFFVKAPGARGQASVRTGRPPGPHPPPWEGAAVWPECSALVFQKSPRSSPRPEQAPPALPGPQAPLPNSPPRSETHRGPGR